jgi:hypothetical protein
MSARRIPTYRHHKPSGQARVIINGKHHYVGPLRLTAQPGKIRPAHCRTLPGKHNRCPPRCQGATFQTS